MITAIYHDSDNTRKIVTSGETPTNALCESA